MKFLKTIALNFLLSLPLVACLENTKTLNTEDQYKYLSDPDFYESIGLTQSEINNKTFNKKSTNAIKTKIDKFPLNFTGDSIVDLISKLNDIQTSRADEFTKTTYIESELSSIKSHSYTFVYDRFTQLVKYNADKEIMDISIDANDFSKKADINRLYDQEWGYLDLFLDIKTKNYIGMNSYGARTNVESDTINWYGVIFSNKGSLFSTTIKIDPINAKLLKPDILIYIVIDLTDLDKNKPILYKDFNLKKATISDPNEKVEYSNRLFVRLKEVGAFKKSTGEIIGYNLF